MNAQIRKLFVALVAMMVTLMGALTYHQFIDAPSLNANDQNRRITDAYWGQERGKIVAGDLVLAESTPTGSRDGVGLTYLRRYPQGAAYAHITGYFPAAIRGQVADLEKSMSQVLSGNSGSLWIQRLQDIFIGSQPQGGNVALTLDPKVQAALVQALDGLTGAAVALNPTTGEILGMYSSPSYDPNSLSVEDSATLLANYQALQNDPNHPMENRALEALYPPGSTFKIVTAAALLKDGGITPDTVVSAPDQLDLPNSSHKLINYANESCGNGEVPLRFAFAKSCNTPFGKLAMELGAQKLQDQAKAFGFGWVADLGLNAVTSDFPIPTAASYLASAAIGQQDVRVTPLQVAMYSAAVANQGVVMQPYLINQELSADFQVLKQYTPKELSRATTPEVAAQLKEMMKGVIASGTGYGVGVNGVEVAGKTGTAETGVGAGKDMWFTGFAPADNPRVAIAIVIEDPAGAMSYSRVLTPRAHNIFQTVVGQ